MTENQNFKEEYLKKAEENLKKREAEINEKLFNFEVAQ